jgi:hypothetical protein
MAEFVILAATAAIVSLPSRLLSVCLLRYLKDDHLRCGLSFAPWPKIISVCGVSVALAAACGCVVVFMLPSWTSMLLRLARSSHAIKKQQSHTFLSHDLAIVESTTKALPVACLWAVWLSVCHISTVSRCVGASLMSLK